MFGILSKHHSRDENFLALISAEMAYSAVDWRCSACWRTNKANTQRCARCGIKWTHGNDVTYTPQKYAPKSPRRTSQSTSWNYTGWDSNAQWSEADWQHGQEWSQTPRSSRRGNTPRKKTPKGTKQKQGGVQVSAPAPEPPWHSQYRGDAALHTTGGEEHQEASENLTLLATALKEANVPIPARVQHIVAENSTPAPTSKSLKVAVDKMDKARKKLKEAQSARANLHSNWRTYIADSLKRWTEFAEQFGKDDAALAERVKAAQEKLQATKEDVDAKKQALEDLDEETHVEISDDEMPDKIDTAENIQASLSNMVTHLQEMKEKAEEAVIEAAESKSKRPRLEEAPGGESNDHSGGFSSPAMTPFAKPGK